MTLHYYQSMGKIDYRQLSRKQYEALGREFWNTCSKATSIAQLTRFLDTLLSRSERVMATRRIQIAKRLLRNEPQTKIQVELNVGQSTVDSVEHWLEKIDPSAKKMLR